MADILDEVLDPEVVHHSLNVRGATAIAAIATHIREIHHAMAGYTAKIEDMVAEGDKLAARCWFSGTYTRELKGLGVAPTGKPFRFDEMMIARFNGGRIVEIWNVADRLSLFQQLGKLPS
jgi:predicted ester cyclase